MPTIPPRSSICGRVGCNPAVRPQTPADFYAEASAAAALT